MNRPVCEFCKQGFDVEQPNEGTRRYYHSQCAESAYQEHLADQASQDYEDSLESTDRCVW